MKTLLATTAMTIALAITNVSVASVSVTETNAVYDVQVKLKTELPKTLTFTADNFYRGDFLHNSREKLSTLTSSDLYTGSGGAEIPMIRSIA